MKAISDETNLERIEHKSKKNMALGTVLGYIAVLISVVSGLVLVPWLIDKVGKEEYGLYGLATSIISIFLMDFGLSTTTTTYLAKLRANNDKNGVERFLSAIFKIYLMLDIIFVVVIAGIYFAAPLIYQKSYNPQQIETLQICLIIVGGYTLVNFPSMTFTNVISTYEKFGMNKLGEIIQKLTYFVMTIICIHFHWGVIGITAVNAISGLIAVVYRFLYMRFYLNVHLDLRKGISKTEMKEIFTFSAWGLILAITNRLIFNITPSILGIVSNATEVALFTVVITMEGYIYTFGSMTASFFLAKIARTEATGSEEEKIAHLQALAEKIGKLQFAVIALIVLGFASVGQEFVLFWMNGDLSMMNIYWCIVAITAYEIVSIPEAIFNGAMYTNGHIKPLAINSIAKAVINLSLSFVLSYFWGAMGAAISIMIARLVDLLLNNIAYKKYLKVSLGKFFKTVYIRGAITTVISLGVGLLLHYIVPLYHGDVKYKLFFNGIVFVLVYSLCTLFITFKKNERLYFIDIILRLLKIRKNKAPKQEVNNDEIKAYGDAYEDEYLDDLGY